MATADAVREAGATTGGSTGRRIFLVWQNPQTRHFAPVGALTHADDGSFIFRYIERARHVEGFRPLVAFPSLDRIYRSESLPAFFENRFMSSRRPEYRGWVQALDLDADLATPFEVLARTGGGRATDTFNLVAEPEIGPTGDAILVFLAHGVRYVDGAEERITHLHAGDQLFLRPEVTNPVNARALFIDAEREAPVGYVPDWMLDCVHDLREGDPGLRVTVEQVNGPDSPHHLRLLCRLEAHLPPGYRPFNAPDFEYIA
jgi:hypothetical protein